MGAVHLIIVTLVVGLVALYLIISPSLIHVRRRNRSLVIPLGDISPIWTAHNAEVTPLTAEESGDGGQPDSLDALWEKSTGEKAEGQAEEKPAAPQPAPVSPARPQGGALAGVKAYVLHPPEKFIAPTPGKPAGKPIQWTDVSPDAQEKAVEKQPPPAEMPAEKPEGKPPAGSLTLSSVVGPFKALYDDCILPFMKAIRGQGAEEIIRDLLRLLDKHGHCPSVVIDSHDAESLDMESVRDNLVKITLKDHTYAVCRYMIGSLKDNYADHEIMIPSALVMSLAHDIGKIPEFRMTGAYNSRDHARVGADKLAEMMEKCNVVWARKAIKAVNDHHSPTKEDLTALLKQSDRQARQAELASCTRAYSVRPFKEWFDLKTYLVKYVAPGVNVTQTGKWNAFSYRGSIYARPDWLLEQAKKMCHAEKALDLNFIYISEKDNAIHMIVSALRRENMTPLLGENYPARKFDVRTSMEVKRLSALYLTAFTVPDYLNIIEIESRKSGFTEIIDTVTPA